MAILTVVEIRDAWERMKQNDGPRRGGDDIVVMGNSFMKWAQEPEPELVRFRVVLEHDGKQYAYDDEWHSDMHDVTFQYEEDDWSCDCNLSTEIREHCDGDFPELPCGETIKLVSLEQLE